MSWGDYTLGMKCETGSRVTATGQKKKAQIQVLQEHTQPPQQWVV